MSERKIVIGLITNTEFLNKVEPIWDSTLLSSKASQRMASWCWNYYNKYKKAPGTDIDGIFFNKVNNGLDEETAQEIEEEILPGLSEEYEKSDNSLSFLMDTTISYFNERKLEILQENIQVLLGKGKIDDARKLAEEYQPIVTSEREDIDCSSPEMMKEIDEAFEINENFVVEFPRQLGDFWNSQMIKGNLIGLLAPEKRGKTWVLIELAMTAIHQKKKVAFFQAGDMTKAQFIRRIGIYLTKRNTLEKYCGVMYEPTRDCIHSQLGTCEKDCRQSMYGCFEGLDWKAVTEDNTIKELIQAHKENPDYEPCWNCSEYWTNHWGVPWVKKIDVGDSPLTKHEAKRAWRKFFIKCQRELRVATYANGTLTVKEMSRILDLWKKEGFEPDMILADYAELFEDPTQEYRHKQNNIWKGFRRISQERNALTIIPTQADADSYDQALLKLKNFSEDKRKYSHCTAFYGLNQDPGGREKGIGLLRINELMVREGDYSVTNCVTILQNLKRGRPFLGSYYGA